MTSYDGNDMLRELRSSTGLVLVRRRSGGSRAGPRTGAMRERVRAAGTGLTSAKGKRSPSQRSRRKQTVSLIHSRPPDERDPSRDLLLAARLETSSPFPSPAASVSSAASSLSCSRCSSSSSLASVSEFEEASVKAPFTCTVPRDHTRTVAGIPALERVPGEFSVTDETNTVCAHCAALSGSRARDILLGEKRTDCGVQQRRQNFLGSRHHRVQPEADVRPHRKSLWLDTPSSWRYSAPYCSSSDHELFTGGWQDGVGRRLSVGELHCDRLSDSEDRHSVTVTGRTCNTQDLGEVERGPSFRKSRCDPRQRVLESRRVRRRNSLDTNRSPDSPSTCVHCDRHLVTGFSSPASSASSHPGAPSLTELSPLSIQREEREDGAGRGSCCSRVLRVCSRMVRMRYVGRCLLLLLLTCLGGLFAHVAVTDYNIDNNHGGGDVMNGFGGSVEVGQGYGGILPSNMLMKMNIRPIPLKEFHDQLRNIRTKFDILRLFLANKDVSDAVLKQQLTERTSSSKGGHLINDVKKRAEVTSEDEAYYTDEEEDPDDASLHEYIDGEVEGIMADDHHEKKSETDTFFEELEEAAYHIAEMENNPLLQCKHPQPTVVYIEDPKRLNRMFHPSCTIINRCKNDSGCCERDKVCGPKTERVVFKTFLVVDVDPVTLMVRPDSQHMVERVPLVEHTECGCREKPRLPDCDQKCPGVFRMYRYGTRCVCDCTSAPNEIFEQCDGVKNGIIPLKHDDLVCIKSKQCGVPKCTVGEFNISTGFCPIKDYHAVPSAVLRARLRHQYPFRHHRRKSLSEGSGDY